MAVGWTGLLRTMLVTAFAFLVIATPARAITILRDPDIENALEQLSLPLIRAAGLDQDQIQTAGCPGQFAQRIRFRLSTYPHSFRV